jgi:asparagine synthase (glutamine-hydrolysing)
MANSLEVRAPLLDHKFMELIASIPSSMKLRGPIGKYILKKSLQGRLPDEVLYRPKMGFGVPIAVWLRKDLKEMAESLLFSSQDDGVLNKTTVRHIWSEHQSGLRNRSTELWTLLMFRLWQHTLNKASA